MLRENRTWRCSSAPSPVYVKGFVSTNAQIRTQNGHQTSQHHPTGSRVRAKGNKQLSHLLTHILPPAAYWPRRKFNLFQSNGSVFSLCHGWMPSVVLCNSARMFVLTDVQPILHCFTASFCVALQGPDFIHWIFLPNQWHAAGFHSTKLIAKYHEKSHSIIFRGKKNPHVIDLCLNFVKSPWNLSENKCCLTSLIQTHLCKWYCLM